MKPGKTVGPSGINDKEFNFNDLSNMMKKMGSLVEVVANDFNKAVVSVNDVFDKLSISLTDEEKDQINNLFDKLTAQDRNALLNMVKNHASDSELKVWWEQRCDNKHIIDILISCSEAFSQIFNTSNDIEKLLDNFGGLLGPDGKKQRKNVMGGLLGMLEKEFGVSFGSENSDVEGQEYHKNDKCDIIENDKCDIIENDKEDNNNENKNDKEDNNTENENETETENDESEKGEDDAVFLSNIGNYLSNAIRYFHSKDGEDENAIKNKILNALSETGVSREYMDKCFDTGVEMGKKLIELEEEYENKSRSDDNIKDQTEQLDTTEKTEETEETEKTEQTEETEKTEQTEETEKTEKTEKTGKTEETEKTEQKKDYWDEVFNNVGKYTKDVRLYFAELDKLSEIKDEEEKNLLIKKKFNEIIRKVVGDTEDVNEFCDTLIENKSIRYGLVFEAVEMVEKQNKINQDCDALINILTPDEMKLFYNNIGGELPLQNKVNCLEHRLDQLNQKLDIIINKFEIKQHSQDNTNGLDNIVSKLDDIALDLELIRNKL